MSADAPMAEIIAAETSVAASGPSLINLPMDIIVTILQQLSVSDLLNMMQTCKTLKAMIVSDNILWKQINRNKLIVHSVDHRLPNNMLSYYHKCRISNNWCKGIYRSRVVICHRNKYMPWMCYDSQEMFLAVGTQLRCYTTDRKGFPMCKSPTWKVDVPKVKRYDIRTNDISRFVIKSGIVACGNRDGCVAIYKQDYPRQKPHLIHHIKDCHENGRAEVSAVEIIGETDYWCVVTASSHNSTLVMWNLRSDYPRYNGFARRPEADVPYVDGRRRIRTNYNTGIKCLSVNWLEDKLGMGLNGNSRPMVLDIESGELLLTAERTKCARQAIRDIRWHNENNIVFVTHSGHLQMIDIRTGQVAYDAKDPFLSTLYCVKTDSNNALVVGTAEYSRCVLFDARVSAHHVQMYFTQRKSSPVYSLDFDSSKLVAAADTSVALVNFNVNVATARRRDYSNGFDFLNYDN